MSIFQLLSLCFALAMIYLVRLNHRREVIGAFEAGVWYGLWLCFILLALSPQLLQDIVGIIHFARVFDLLTVIAFMVVVTIVSLSYFHTKENAKKLESLSRKIALDHTAKKTSKRN